jgi:hypothetical protein
MTSRIFDKPLISFPNDSHLSLMLFSFLLRSCFPLVHAISVNHFLGKHRLRNGRIPIKLLSNRWQTRNLCWSLAWKAFIDFLCDFQGFLLLNLIHFNDVNDSLPRYYPLRLTMVYKGQNCLLFIDILSCCRNAFDFKKVKLVLFHI